MENIKDIYFTGDIHGNFEPFVYCIGQRGLYNSAVIVAGDIGMGFYKHNYYIDTFKYINKKLIKRNIHLYFIRGNHDNPDYFNNTPEDIKEFSNIHLVQDYTVLHINTYNILCVGGATSVDKKFRTKDIDWWEFENVLPYQKLNCKNIDIVVTHCAPIFCPPKYERISWMDDELDAKAREDRRLLAQLYFDLIKENKPKYWFYGHYHKSYESRLPNNEEFSEYELNLLMSGNLIDNIEYLENMCKFIGLDMIDRNKIDLYKI